MYKIILIAVYFLLLPGLFSNFIHLLQNFIHSNAIFKPFLIGSGIGIPVYYLLIKNIKGFGTFEHELTHAVTALCFGGKVTQFISTKDRGGFVKYEGVKLGQFGLDIVSFAPYVLPTFTFFSVLIYPILPNNYQYYLIIWLGLTFIYHTISTSGEIVRNFTYKPFRSASGKMTRSDLGKRGLFYSTVSIITLTLIFHLIILVILIDNYHGLLPVFKSIGQEFIFSAKIIFVKLNEFGKEILNI